MLAEDLGQQANLHGASKCGMGSHALRLKQKPTKPWQKRDPAAAVVDLFDRGLYFECNFEPNTEVESFPCQNLMSVTAARPGSHICEAASGLTDTSWTGLLMLGKAGLGTKFHVDRTKAENVAFSVIHKPKPSKLAWDHHDTRHLATYAAIQRDVASLLFRGNTVGDDYMAVAPTFMALYQLADTASVVVTFFLDGSNYSNDQAACSSAALKPKLGTALFGTAPTSLRFYSFDTVLPRRKA
ncbi:TPA: hypothetical protein ACH3X1_000030 [Trebouxia sp. C0004]